MLTPEQHLEAAEKLLNERHMFDPVIGHILCGILSLAITWSRRKGILE